FSSRDRYERAQKLARTAARPLARDRDGDGTRTISTAPPPLAGWTTSRDLPTPAKESFREWWRRPRGAGTEGSAPAGASHPEARTAGTMSAFSPHIGANADTVSTSGTHDVHKVD